MSTQRIRDERPADIEAVRAVHRAAFPTSAESAIVDALRAKGRALVSLVADLDGRIVGHILFSPVTLDPSCDEPCGAGLAPLAVGPGHQRRGIGSALVRAGLSRCAALGVGFVVVLGDPLYYGRFGFARASALGLANEYGADEAFGVLELRSGCLAGRRALVRYAPEFARSGA